MNDFSCMWVTAVSFHFISPSIISPRSVRYQRAWNLPRYASSCTWICESHLTLATPYQPGTSSRSGAPWCFVSGSPFSAQARNGSARQRLLARQAAAELLVDLELLRPPLDFLFAVIGAEEDELARRRPSRRPASSTVFSGTPVQRPLPHSALQRTAVARALEAGDQFRAAHLLQLVERERLRPVHQARDLQLEGRRVDVGMAVVLRRGELVLRRERAVDRPDVERPPVGRRLPPDVVRECR